MLPCFAKVLKGRCSRDENKVQRHQSWVMAFANWKHIYADHCLKYTHQVISYFVVPSIKLRRRNQKKFFEKTDCDVKPKEKKQKKDKGDKEDENDKDNKGDDRKGDNKRPAKNRDDGASKKKSKKDK